MTNLKSAFEERIEQIKQDLSNHVKKEVKQACTVYMSEELPYLENDTVQNVEHRTQEALKLFLEEKEPKTSLEFKVFDLLNKEFNGQEIRRKIFEENKDELSRLISNDIIKENQELRERNNQIEHLKKMLEQSNKEKQEWKQMAHTLADALEESKRRIVMKTNKIMTRNEIKELVEALHIGCVSKRYLVKFVDSFWFEHETTVEAECQFDAIEKVQEQFKNASHFSVSEL